MKKHITKRTKKSSRFNSEKKPPLYYGSNKNWGSMNPIFLDSQPVAYSPVIEMKDMTKKKVKEITKRLLARDRAERGQK